MTSDGKTLQTGQQFSATGDSSTNALDVVPDARQNQWIVSREGDPQLREAFRTKEEAVKASTARARWFEPSQVRVHSADGRMESESTYGADPNRFVG